MPAARTIKKKISPKIAKRKLQRAKVSNKLLVALTLLIVIIVGVVVWKPWTNQNISMPFSEKKITVVKPKTDMGRARQLTIDPSKDTVMQIVTRENVRITLDVPKGAIAQKTNVKLIPFYYEKENSSPTAGVLVSPATINFTKPVTLSFNFNDTEFKNIAPITVDAKQLRKYGQSQVLQIDSDAKSYTPTLVARGIETEKFLPARILTGGAYVFSLDGANQKAIAEKALSAQNMHSLTVIESATALLFNNQTLSADQDKKAKAAVSKILAKQNPPALEMYAAAVLQKKLTDKTFSFIPVAHAYETGEGFFQAACRSDGLKIEEYVGFAQTAELMGHEHIGESCLNKAKNLIEKRVNEVLANPNASLKELQIALQDVMIVGLDDDSNLDEKLTERSKQKAVEDAKKVADDPNATPIQAATQLQILQGVGVEEGPTYEKLENTVKEEIGKYEQPKDHPTDAEPTIVEEEILDSAIMSAIGIAMAKAFGFEQLDEDSVKAKFEQMAAGTKAMNEAAYAVCLELGGEDCEGTYSKIAGEIRVAEAEGYRVASDIGNLQSQEYEEAEYTEHQGEVELYFEPTEEPVDAAGIVEEGTTNDGSFNEDYGPDSTNAEPVYEEASYETTDTGSQDTAEYTE
jgi:hypothetical protein